MTEDSIPSTDLAARLKASAVSTREYAEAAAARLAHADAALDRAAVAEAKLARARAFVSAPGNWSALDGRRHELLNILNGTDQR